MSEYRKCAECGRIVGKEEDCCAPSGVAPVGDATTPLDDTIPSRDLNAIADKVLAALGTNRELDELSWTMARVIAQQAESLVAAARVPSRGTSPEERNVVRVTAEGVIVIEEGATDEEMNRAFLRLGQFMAGDLHGLHESRPNGSNVIGARTQSAGRDAKGAVAQNGEGVASDAGSVHEPRDAGGSGPASISSTLVKRGDGNG